MLDSLANAFALEGIAIYWGIGLLFFAAEYWWSTRPVSYLQVFLPDVAALTADDPGMTSYQLISRVYHWFGFEDDRIPYSSLAPNKKRMIDPSQIISMNTDML